jgi:hypothetical protein
VIFLQGSGTTLAAAQKMARKWLGIDSGDFSIQCMQKTVAAGIWPSGCLIFFDPTIKIT